MPQSSVTTHATQAAKQVPAEVVPSLSVSNGDQSEAPSKVTLPGSVPNADQSQAPPEVTPSGPEADHSVDNAPSLPGNGQAQKQLKKRKRLNSKGDRKSKKPHKSKKAGPIVPDTSDCDPDGSSPAAPTRGETEHTVPVKRRGITRLTAVKQQLSEALENNMALKNSLALLESDIDKKNKELVNIKKCEIAQK